MVVGVAAVAGPSVPTVLSGRSGLPSSNPAVVPADPGRNSAALFQMTGMAGAQTAVIVVVGVN